MPNQTALACQDRNNWRELPIEIVKYLVCPDCFTLIPDRYIKQHVNWHIGLNLYDEHFQNYRKVPDVNEEGGS